MTTPSHVEVLGQLASQLDAYAESHPHLQPYSLLSDASGEDKVLNANAAQVWDQLLREFPDDELALHHVAIIHHGLALRGYRELVVTHQATLPHWKRALECWAKLLRHDPFWNRLRATWIERAKNVGDPVAQRLVDVPLEEFRRRLPAHLLKAHITIIQDMWRQQSGIAKDHLALIVGSDFDAALVRRTRRDVYGLLVGDFQVLLSEQEFRKARELLESYLRIDPANPQALADRLLIGTKEAEKQQGLTAKERRFAADEIWADQLKPFAKVSPRVTPEDALQSASVLSDYYFARGLASREEGYEAGTANVSKAISLVTDAATFMAEACDYERTGQRSVGLYLNICFNFIMLVEGGGQGHAAASRLMTECRRRVPQSAMSYMMEAMLLHLSEDSGGSQSALSKADSLLNKCPDTYATDCLARVRQMIAKGSPRIAALVDESVAAFKVSNFAQAKRVLEQALELAPPDSQTRLEILSYLTVALLRMGSTVAAKSRLNEANRLLVRFPGCTTAELLKNLSAGL